MPREASHGESYAEERRRQREFHMQRATSYHSGRRTFLSGLLALALFLTIGALAVWQATSPGPARNVLGAGIARITDLDRLIAEDLPVTANNPDAPPLPGFPIDIQLTHADVAGKSPADVRELVLDRAAARVYEDGVHAFDRTGQQSVNRFSADGMLASLADQVTRTNHDRARLAAIVLGAISALLAVALFSVSEEGRRARLLGTVILAAGLPGLLLSGGAWLLVGRLGGSDAFESAMHSLARSVIDVPLRDFIVVTALGVLTLLAGPMVRLVSRPFSDDGDESYVDEREWYASTEERFEDEDWTDDEDWAEGEDWTDEDFDEDEEFANQESSARL